MIDVLCVRNWADVGQLVLWMLPVLGIVKAVFRGYPADRLAARLRYRNLRQTRELTRLRWEINNAAAWNRRAATGMQAREGETWPVVLLDSADLEKRDELLVELERERRPGALVSYVLSCWPCQVFWASLLLWVVTRGLSDGLGAVCTGLAYAGATLLVILVTWWLGSRPAAAPHAAGRPGGGGCGHR